MDIMNYVQQYAEQIGGQFTDYDHSKSVVVVPLNDSRFQTVLALRQKSPVSGRDQAIFSSKVCEFQKEFNINLEDLMKQNAHFDYSKFVLEDGFIKVEASCLASTANEAQLKEMLQEVAQLADHYENKLTGKDIH
jgi:hypothetical protein